VWAGLAAVLALTVAFSFAPVRTWAGQFLGLFRVQQIQLLPLDTTMLSNLHGEGTLAEQVSRMFSDSVKITREPGEPVAAASAAEASELAGFNVRLLAAAEGEPRITVQDGAAFEVVLDRERAQALLNEAGRGDLQLPESVDGATLRVDIPAGATVEYGVCPSGTEGEFVSDGPADWDVLTTCVMLAQVPSPSVEAPPDLDVAQLAELGLQFTGMSSEEAAAFSQSVDWTTTLVLPLPSHAGDYRPVTVDGVSGNLIYRGPGEVPARYLVLWVKDGVVHALSGFGQPDEGIALANSIQ
jgi:hypothetical protein